MAQKISINITTLRVLSVIMIPSSNRIAIKQI